MQSGLALLCSCVLAWMCAAPVHAGVDADPDQLGVYFDLAAGQVCRTAPTAVPFSAYVILTNPSHPEVWGFEFGYRVETAPGQEAWVFRLNDITGCGLWIDPNPDTWQEGDYICGFASPQAPVDGNVVLVTWQFLLLGPETPLQFFLGPAWVESIADGLPAYDAGGEVLPLGVSSGDPALPVAAVNGECSVVGTSPTTFGGLKALYR